MKRAIIFLLLIFYAGSSYSQNEDTSYRKGVAAFIFCVKHNKREQLASIVSYPLRREYPLPGVKNKADFLKRYDEIFDARLVQAIVHSSIAKDWSAVGWRGIMLLNGDVWLDYDGRLIAVNYQSPAEQNKRQILINAEKASLHEALRNYQEPVCILETSKYRVRIDIMADGKYRYASWQIKDKMSNKPELIIENGTVEFDGTGGNHTYHFTNEGYKYDCDIIVMGETNAPPALLTISKGDKEVLLQRAKLSGN